MKQPDAIEITIGGSELKLSTRLEGTLTLGACYRLGKVVNDITSPLKRAKFKGNLIDNLSARLKAEYPEISGFSRPSLYRYGIFFRQVELHYGEYTINRLEEINLTFAEAVKVVACEVAVQPLRSWIEAVSVGDMSRKAFVKLVKEKAQVKESIPGRPPVRWLRRVVKEGKEVQENLFSDPAKLARQFAGMPIDERRAEKELICEWVRTLRSLKQTMDAAIEAWSDLIGAAGSNGK